MKKFLYLLLPLLLACSEPQTQTTEPEVAEEFSKSASCQTSYDGTVAGLGTHTIPPNDFKVFGIYKTVCQSVQTRSYESLSYIVSASGNYTIESRVYVLDSSCDYVASPSKSTSYTTETGWRSSGVAAAWCFPFYSEDCPEGNAWHIVKIINNSSTTSMQVSDRRFKLNAGVSNCDSN